ncbi:MAG: hypothetical protein FWG71_08030 [Synergistaceae bacterium]|nr:hypothetical protein [Synergistaceae bacterium]
MKVLRLEPHKQYDCHEVAEIFSPEFCKAAGWTEENNIPGGAAVSDDTAVDPGWLYVDGVLRTDTEGIPERPLVALERRESESLARIEEFEQRSIRAMRAVTLQGKTKAAQDAAFLMEYEAGIQTERDILTGIRAERKALTSA